MRHDRPVLLFENDRPVLSALQFALALQGFAPADGEAAGVSPAAACCLVIDQRFRGDGLAFLQALRVSGTAVPAVLLATNPTARVRDRAADLGAILVEKPLLGEELTEALRHLLPTGKAA